MSTIFFFLNLVDTHNFNFSATLLPGQNALSGQTLLVRDTKNGPRDKLTALTHNHTMTNSVVTCLVL